MASRGGAACVYDNYPTTQLLIPVGGSVLLAGKGGSPDGRPTWALPEVLQDEGDGGPEWAPEIRTWCAAHLGVPAVHVTREVAECDHMVLVVVDLVLAPTPATPPALAAVPHLQSAEGSRGADGGGVVGGSPTVASVRAAVAAAGGTFRWASAADVQALRLLPAGCLRCDGQAVGGDALVELLAAAAAGTLAGADRVSGPPGESKPWEHIGWAAMAFEWARSVAGGVTDVQEVKSWAEGVVLRLIPAGGENIPPRRGMWFKACRGPPPQGGEGSGGPSGASEVALTALLAAHFPFVLPRLVATDVAREWMVLEDGGEPLSVDGGDKQAVADALGRQGDFLLAYGRMQVASAGMLGELLAVGCRDLRPHMLVGAVSEAATLAVQLQVDVEQVGDDPGLFSTSLDTVAVLPADWDALLSHAQTLCDQLDADEWVRPALIHHDLHPGNLICAPDGSIRAIDWSQTVVAHPYLELPVGIMWPTAHFAGLGVPAAEMAQVRGRAQTAAPLVCLAQFCVDLFGATALGATSPFGRELVSRGRRQLLQGLSLLRAGLPPLQSPPPPA